MNIEKQFLHYILTDRESVSQVIIKGIKDSFIIHPNLSSLYKVAMQYYKKYGKLLTSTVLLKVLGRAKDLEEEDKKDILMLLDELIDLKPEEPIEFIVDEIIENEKERKFNLGLSQALDVSEKKSIGDGIKSIKRTLASITGLGSTAIVSGSYKESIDDRKSLYLKRKKNPKSAYGYLTPFKSLNNYTNGTQPGEFCLVISATSEGKSTFLTNLGYYSYKRGYNVVYIQIEMSKDQLELRLDAIASNLAAKEIKLGKLGEEGEKKYFKTLEQQKDFEGEFEIVDIPAGCTTDIIAAKLDDLKVNFKPDIVIVDYFDIMDAADSEKADAGWETMRQIAKGLKSLAREHKVTLWTAAQVDAAGQKSKAESYKVWNTALTKYLPAQTDITLSLKATDTDVIDATGTAELTVAILKNRNNSKGQFRIFAEFGKFRMEEVPGVYKQ